MKRYRNYDLTIAVTKRCNARCSMCSQWAFPTKPDEELKLGVLDKIPFCKFVQITGGEPFVRSDMGYIIKILRHKAKRILINTNGYYTDKILEVARLFPDIAFRISLDGERETHNRIRGINIYDQAVETIEELEKLGIKDIGISFTLQDDNYMDLLSVYQKSKDRNWGFSCTVTHNSFYFNKNDNNIVYKELLEKQLRQLVKEELKSERIIDWAKAFMNDYNIRQMKGESLPIRCDAGVTSFFIDAFGNVLPCNMTSSPWIMGNLYDNTWDEILSSAGAKNVISRCRTCKLPCWSMCNVQTAIKKRFWVPAWWLVWRKFCKRY